MSSAGPRSEYGGGEALGAARQALARHDWQAAYDAAGRGDSPGADRLSEAAGLDVHAEAAWWLGRMEECIASREAAYAIFVECDASRSAGQCAVWLYEHYCFKAQPNIGGAWLRRARHRLDGDVECVEYGNLVLREVEVAHGRGDLDQAAEQARAIIELGRRLRVADLEAEALQALGRVVVDQGHSGEGLEYLDEAMLFAVEGKLRPYATGKVYCSLITACEELGDYRRAAEWTDATARWSENHPFAVFPGLCRVHRAWALQCRGEWARAEQEVIRACEELVGVSRAHAAVGFVELGEVRRRVGDLEGAEDAFREAETLCGRPQAGLALLRLAQGRLDAATAIIVRALDEETWNRLARAKLLPARVQIAVAHGDLESALAAATELEAIASDFDSPALLAAAASAQGRLSLARGDATEACVALRQALDRWEELGVPYEVATARLLLGQACRAAGDEDGAIGSFTAAEAMFEHLGAALDIRAARDLHRPAPLPAGLTHREAQVLRLVASGRSNKDIAATMFLSERTVARHLSNIFTKTGVSSRSAATAYAFEHGLAGAR
ncbi:MAG: LuxR C-terminal-related transcriptional regulator [Acidimicrobiia bacterium]